VIGPSAALRDDVADTLQAAIADPNVTARLGRLTKAERWSGFAEFGDAARRGLWEAERSLKAAEAAYEQAKRVSSDAAAAVKKAKAGRTG
jgi:hypothetical protein